MSDTPDYKRIERPQLERRLAAYVDYVPCGCYDKTGNDVDKCMGQAVCARADLRRLVRRLRSITQRNRSAAPPTTEEPK